jgi:hypothetical protein
LEGTTPRKIDLESLARGYTEASVRRLGAHAVGNTKQPPAVHIEAIKVLLDRGWGRPKQDTTVKGDLNIVIRKMLDGE